MSYLLYDLINSDSYLLKNTDISYSIYNSFAWCIQNKLKINKKNYDDKIKIFLHLMKILFHMKKNYAFKN